MKGLSLFANVGIAETYLYKNNIEIVVANELIPERAKFYSHLYPNTNMICGDIREKEIFTKILLLAKKEKVDFILATPPCQGMSVAGKMNENDIRNHLIIDTINMIKALSPNYVLIENVPTILKTYILINNERIKIVDFIKNELTNDYNINYKVVDCADYGVPQNRKRAIFLLSKIKKIEFPKLDERKISVKEAIGHLPSLESGEKSNIKFHFAKNHNANHILWMKNTPTGKTAFENEFYFPKKENGDKIKGFKTTYKRIDWDKPAPTITMCNGAISSQNNVHPGRLKKDGTYSDARVLTILELLILTGLPQNWNIPEWASENLVRKVIGEGIPPKLIEKITKNFIKQ